MRSMTQTVSVLNKISASDDSRRMLLRCILRDARELHFDGLDACPRCYAISYSCGPGHHQAHREPIERYRDLDDELESYDGIIEGKAYPLTGDDLDTLAAALSEAITYRTGRNAPEDRALLAAYRMLAAAGPMSTGA